MAIFVYSKALARERNRFLTWTGLCRLKLSYEEGGSVRPLSITSALVRLTLDRSSQEKSTLFATPDPAHNASFVDSILPRA